jgi:hypothetical protein
MILVEKIQLAIPSCRRERRKFKQNEAPALCSALSGVRVNCLPARKRRPRFSLGHIPCLSDLRESAVGSPRRVITIHNPEVVPTS